MTTLLWDSLVCHSTWQFFRMYQSWGKMLCSVALSTFTLFSNDVLPFSVALLFCRKAKKRWSIAIQRGNTIPFRVKIWTKLKYCHSAWQYYTFRSKDLNKAQVLPFGVAILVPFRVKIKLCHVHIVALPTGTKLNHCHPARQNFSLTKVLQFSVAILDSLHISSIAIHPGSTV